MKNQLTSIIRDLFTSVYGLFSNPQAVRLVLIILVVCFALAALCVPAVSALASGLPTGGGSSTLPSGS
ncbi:MAG: hypothetical protein ACYDEO_17710 [Aggregatilineales bacterium]